MFNLLSWFTSNSSNNKYHELEKLESELFTFFSNKQEEYDLIDHVNVIEKPCNDMTIKIKVDKGD